MFENIDHYKTLNISEKSTQEEIKKAYRKLASKYHPDKNKDTEEQFKAVSNAYEILSDIEQRQIYDLSRKQTRSPLGDVFGNTNFRKTYLLKITLEQAYTGTVVDTTQFGEINIPSGIRSGTKFLYGSGAAIEIYIEKHKKFARSNDDLLVTVNLDVFQAICGTELLLTHLDGSTLKIKIPKYIQRGQLIRLPGKGLKNPETRIPGDVLLQCEISMPTTLTDDEMLVIIALNKHKSITL